MYHPTMIKQIQGPLLALRHIHLLLLFTSIGALCLLTSCNRQGPSWPEKVEEHMRSSEAGTLVWQAMEAHGGYKSWISNGALKFQWIYRMKDLGPEAIVDTVQIVDPKTMQARHEVSGTNTVFGWTGEKAWIHPPDAVFNPPPRFWALTPLYFIGIPFVFGDLNARFEKVDDWVFEGQTYKQVKVTYDASAGDSPEDYYILLIHPDAKKVHGARYIVTSDLVTDGTPKPEKLITLESFADVEGILLPTEYRSFTMNKDTLGDLIRDASAKDISWVKPSPDMSPPQGARSL